MAKERLVRKTCDRCSRVITEAATDADPKLDIPNLPLLYAEAKGLGFEETIRLEDLCEKCNKRVTELFSQLRLEPKDKENDGKPAEGKAEPDAEPEAKPTPLPPAKEEPKEAVAAKRHGETRRRNPEA